MNQDLTHQPKPEHSVFLSWCLRNRWILFAGLALYLSTAWFNVGIIATDDYEFGIARIVPAQNWTALSIIKASGIRSPIPNLALFAFTKTALSLGITEPVTQLKFALIFVALFSYITYTFLAFLFFPKEGTKSRTALFLLSFYFICPMAFTRPLIENLAAPFLFISCWAACEYFDSSKGKYLLLSVAALTLSSMFRFQVGVCSLALVLLVLIRRQWKHLFLLGASGLVGIVLSGALDWFYKGGLHASLVAYSDYQASNIQRFGTQPFYVFIALFIGLSMPPLLFQKYKNFSWRENFNYLVPALLFFVIFLISHSVVVHKEERFMVPLLPIFFVLITPLALYTWKTSRWRRVSFLSLNFLLLPLASYNAPQTNLIESALFVSTHPRYEHVISVEGTLFNFPRAFIPRQIEVQDFSAQEYSNKTAFNCNEVIMVRKDIRESIKGFDQLEFLGASDPGILERVVIALNPKQNKRRGPIEHYSKPNCS